MENTPARVSTPTIDLTVDSATSQREVADVHEHAVKASQSLCVVLTAQVSACLPSATIMCKSFAVLRIKSSRKVELSSEHSSSAASQEQLRPLALLHVDSLWNFRHAKNSRANKE